MIGLIFYHGTEIVYIQVAGANINFSNSHFGAKMATIDGLKISKEGAIKEHPDLKDREDWKDEAIKRFKDAIKALPNEDAIVEYIVTDLKKYGYVPKFKQKAGFRREVLK